MEQGYNPIRNIFNLRDFKRAIISQNHLSIFPPTTKQEISYKIELDKEIDRFELEILNRG